MRPRFLALVLGRALVLMLLLGASGCDQDVRDRVAPRAGVAAAAILRSWDARRSRAWADGSLTALRALYVPGSRTGAADLRMLEAWRARGLRVRDLTTQLLSVAVLAHGSGRLRLRVTDRVVRAEAVTVGDHGWRSGLPQDRPSAYVIEMERYDGQWLVRETTAA